MLYVLVPISPCNIHIRQYLVLLTLLELHYNSRYIPVQSINWKFLDSLVLQALIILIWQFKGNFAQTNMGLPIHLRHKINAYGLGEVHILSLFYL